MLEATLARATEASQAAGIAKNDSIVTIGEKVATESLNCCCRHGEGRP